MRPWYQRPRAWLLVVAVAGATVVAMTGIAFGLIYVSADIPPVESLRLPDPSVVLDRDGDVIATLDPAAVREHRELASLPQHVLHAHLAAEDRAFYEHRGFSPTAIVRAAWANVRSGGTVQGASTITQQYVDLAVEDVDDSYLGKFREVAYAAKLNGELPKDRVLEMYLNRVPYGQGAIGIEAAAQTYFGVSAEELDVNQAATLAGMIAAPTAFNPERNPEGAERRRNYVLDGMAEEGWLERAETDELRAAALPEVRTDPLVSFGQEAYFLDAVRAAVPRVLENEGQDPFLGLRIHTTLDVRAQKFAQDTLREQLRDTPYSGAIVTIDPADGAVRTLVGGLDYEQQQFNVATQGLRQAGSAFKPFTLAAWVDAGNSPSSTVDAPRTLTLGDAGNEDEIWNYTQRGYGTVTVRDATINSINTAYVNMTTRIGADDVVEMAHRLGIERDLPEVPSVTLGTGGVTPLDMADAYATLAAGGVDREPFVIERIEMLDTDAVIYEHEVTEERAVGQNVAAVVTDVLRDVVQQGTGVAAALDEHPVAGKTGTTNEYRDAWFVGYTPQLATSVWVGRLDNQPMEDVTGGSIPAATWQQYMSAAMAEMEPATFPEPDLDALVDEDVDETSPSDTETSPSPTDTATTPTETETTPSETETTPSETETSPTAPASPSGTEPTPSEPPPDDGGDGGDVPIIGDDEEASPSPSPSDTSTGSSESSSGSSPTASPSTSPTSSPSPSPTSTA